MNASTNKILQYPKVKKSKGFRSYCLRYERLKSNGCTQIILPTRTEKVPVDEGQVLKMDFSRAVPR